MGVYFPLPDFPISFSSGSSSGLPAYFFIQMNLRTGFHSSSESPDMGGSVLHISPISAMFFLIAGHACGSQAAKDSVSLNIRCLFFGIDGILEVLPSEIEAESLNISVKSRISSLTVLGFSCLHARMTGLEFDMLGVFLSEQQNI